MESVAFLHYPLCAIMSNCSFLTPQHWAADDSQGSKGKVSGLLAEQRTHEYDGEVCRHGHRPPPKTCQDLKSVQPYRATPAWPSEGMSIWKLPSLLSILSPTPTLLHSNAVPIYTETLENLFLLEKVQEALELHIQRLCPEGHQEHPRHSCQPQAAFHVQ